MKEQKIAAVAVLNALNEDRKIKGSKRKKIDHWKSVACQAIGISKMGSARWGKILEWGYAQGYFTQETVGSSQKLVLKPLKELSNKEEVVVEELIEEETIEVEEVVVLGTREPHPNLNEGMSDQDLPRKGDHFYYLSYQGQVVQGEVSSSYTFADMINPDGTWQTVLLNDLHDTKKQARQSRKGTSDMRAFYRTNELLRAERNRLLKEIEDLKAMKG